jgi:hypothetical protein
MSVTASAAARLLAAALACLALASCDQFARVGIEDVEPSDPPPIPSVDAGGGPDAAMTPEVDAAAMTDAAIDPRADCPDVEIAVCNPVTNEGCSAALGQQCGIDLVSHLTGYCVFTAPPALGMPDECLNTGVTESCPIQFTCFAGKCHRICLCDADCDPGLSCSEPIDSTGFNVCREP